MAGLYVLDQAMGDDAEPSLMTIKFDPLSPKAEVLPRILAIMRFLPMAKS